MVSVPARRERTRVGSRRRIGASGGQRVRKLIFSMLAVGTAATGTAASAQTSGDFGSAVYQTVRNCGGTAATPCNGQGQRIIQSAIAGGAGQSASSTLTGTGTALGSSATADVKFVDFGFPQVKASVGAAGNVRVGDNIYTFQSYTYTGEEEFDLLLSASFHIVDSSTDGGNGLLPGGAIASAGFTVWNRDDFDFYASEEWSGVSGGFASPLSLVNQPYLFGQGYGCDDYQALGGPGPRALSFATRSLTGGEANIGIAQNNCEEQTLTLYRGDQFVIGSYVQLIANRGGFIDATGTFNLGLAPDTGEANAAAFRSGVVLGAAGVPEPATWACMIIGFGLTGGALRRRSRGTIRMPA